MFKLTPQHIIKYLSVALIVAVILYMLPGEKVETNYIIMVSLVAALFSFVLDILSEWYMRKKTKENMSDIEMNYPDPLMVADKYGMSTEQQDYANTGLNYDNDLPGYYLVNNGKYSDGRIPYSESMELIETSKLHDLYQQQNFNILSSPHTHIGKNRGPLNWDPCCTI